MKLFEDLKFRGLIYQVSNKQALQRKLLKEKLVLYTGFDPTASSLHVGHLLNLFTLKRFQNFGFQPIALIGGATALIGDPSGKLKERPLLTLKEIRENKEKIKLQLKRILKNHFSLKIVDNYSWFRNLNLLKFLRETGKHFSLGYMLAKESIKTRLEGSGISFTEFSYMLLQAYDFLKLYQKFNCQLQIGGSDQWGNICAGIELVRKTLNKEVYGLTLPLLTRPDGTKFGKTESGTIWLDTSKTSVYNFYQFWFHTEDKEVIKFLKYFTFLEKKKILELETKVKLRPELREAQKILAFEVTSLVHGKRLAFQAQKISQALFYGHLKDLTLSEFEEAFKEIPSVVLKKKGRLEILELLVALGAVQSKREARQLIERGAISLNGELVKDPRKKISPSACLFKKYLLIKRGKKKYFLAKWLY